ncbi:diguanylate cyclase [uncultured Legionella sp.]|uniref:GGDEF domain-containing protein n=1 Tax=uncultured Legionella sp. TaxID=210934 RepID=UPI002633E7E5|nr:diguanylate cyclase [uncultured Legionella sp.]
MNSYELKTNKHLLHHFFIFTAKSVFFNLLLALLIVVYLHSTHIPLSDTWPWLALIIVVTIIRFACALIGQRQKIYSKLLVIYFISITTVIFLGCLWGYFYWHYFDEMTVFQRMFLLLVVAAITTGSTISMASSLVAFYSFILPFFIPIFILNLNLGENDGIALILAVTLIFCFLIITHIANNKMLKNNIELILKQMELNNQLKKFNKKLSIVSITDELTNLANRRYFRERLIADWVRTKRSSLPLSLIIIDIDHFKQCNDHYGHLYGDECLKQIARIISELAGRETDLAARFGGDELSVILYDTIEINAKHFAERIQQTIKHLHIKNELSPISDDLTVSVGIASMIPQIDDDYELLFSYADKALYEAKNQGRNCIITYQF